MPSPVLNVAPAPSPALSAPASNAAATDAAQTATGQPANPFAAVLQRQIHDQTAANQPSKDLTPLPIAEDAAMPTAAQPQPDALSALAPMLAGIVQAQQTPKNSDKADAKKTDAEDAAAATIPLAAPIQMPSVALPTTPAKPAESASAEQPAGFGAVSRQTANLAGDGLQDAVSRAGSGKEAASHDSFESLLAAPKEPALLAAGQAVASNAAPAPTHAAASAATPVASPVGTPAWNGEIGDRLAWMATRHESRAELVLNPPHLGRLEISLSMNGDQANALFVSANPAVRDALENAVPRLREILQDVGITLGQAQVGTESFGQPSNQGENGDNHQARGLGRDEDGLPSAGFAAGTPVQWARQGNGLVDTFA